MLGQSSDAGTRATRPALTPHELLTRGCRIADTVELFTLRSGDASVVLLLASLWRLTAPILPAAQLPALSTALLCAASCQLRLLLHLASQWRSPHRRLLPSSKAVLLYSEDLNSHRTVYQLGLADYQNRSRLGCLEMAAVGVHVW